MLKLNFKNIIFLLKKYDRYIIMHIIIINFTIEIVFEYTKKLVQWKKSEKN